MIGFEGRYQVSNTGLIRAILDNHGNYVERVKKTYIRSDTCQYEYVSLSVKDQPFTEAVHRAVAKAFIDNPENKPLVNHLDGNKLNNNAYNLEWCTQSENHKHAWAIGLHCKEKLTERMIGIKSGKTSKYRNVTYDPSRNKWKGTMKHQGKMLPQKRFNTEIEAAEYVNYLIATYSLSRPKNIIV